MFSHISPSCACINPFDVLTAVSCYPPCLCPFRSWETQLPSTLPLQDDRRRLSNGFTTMHPTFCRPWTCSRRAFSSPFVKSSILKMLLPAKPISLATAISPKVGKKNRGNPCRTEEVSFFPRAVVWARDDEGSRCWPPCNNFCNYVRKMSLASFASVPWRDDHL